MTSLHPAGSCITLMTEPTFELIFFLPDAARTLIFVTDRSNRTILIVDDDPAFLAETEKALGDAGYQVLQATDGVRAARLLDELEGKIDLAIIDLALPGLNGFELIGAISRRPNRVKIIATSGVFRDDHLETATSLGAHAAIRKPRVLHPLPTLWLGTVKRLIGAPEAGEAARQ